MARGDRRVRYCGISVGSATCGFARSSCILEPKMLAHTKLRIAESWLPQVLSKMPFPTTERRTPCMQGVPFGASFSLLASRAHFPIVLVITIIRNWEHIRRVPLRCYKQLLESLACRHLWLPHTASLWILVLPLSDGLSYDWRPRETQITSLSQQPSSELASGFSVTDGIQRTALHWP